MFYLQIIKAQYYHSKFKWMTEKNTFLPDAHLNTVYLLKNF